MYVASDTALSTITVGLRKDLKGMISCFLFREAEMETDDACCRSAHIAFVAVTPGLLIG